MSSKGPCTDERITKARMPPENHQWRAPEIGGAPDLDDESAGEAQRTDETRRPPTLERIVR